MNLKSPFRVLFEIRDALYAVVQQNEEMLEMCREQAEATRMVLLGMEADRTVEHLENNGGDIIEGGF